MIEERAYILSVTDNEALIEIKHQSSCNSCSSQSNCGTSSLSQLFGNRPSQFKLNLNQHQQLDSYKSGDEVLIGLEDTSYLKASLLIYLWPLALMLIFALFAEQLLGVSDGLVLLFSLLGLWAGFKISNTQAQSRAEFLTPQLIKKL